MVTKDFQYLYCWLCTEPKETDEFTDSEEQSYFWPANNLVGLGIKKPLGEKAASCHYQINGRKSYFTWH